MFSDDISKYKKARGVNKNVNERIHHSEYKDVLLKSNPHLPKKAL